MPDPSVCVPLPLAGGARGGDDPGRPLPYLAFRPFPDPSGKREGSAEGEAEEI